MWKMSGYVLVVMLVFSIPIVNVSVGLQPERSAIASTLASSSYNYSNPTKAEAVVPSTEFNITSTGEQFDGYNLFVLRQESRTTDENAHELLIMHNNGSIVYSTRLGMFHSLDYLNTEFINSTHFMYAGGVDGDIHLVNFYSNTETIVHNRGHHDIEYNYETNSFFTLKFYTRQIEDQEYVYDRIEEIDVRGVTLWAYDLYPLVPHDIEVYGDIYASGNGNFKKDVTHSNTVFYNHEDKSVLVNSRNANTFYKINRTTSELIWGLGELGNFTLYDINGQERSSLFYNAHAVEQISENRYLLFDNDRNNRTDLNSRTSRMIEIEVDEDEMTAKIVWEYSAPISYYSAIWGDADRLPNGNTLGTFGTVTHPESTIGARLVEVSDMGEIVWETNFPLTATHRYGIYRNERINFSPYVFGPDNTTIPVDTTHSMTWETFYNFRNKVDFIGAYKIFVNGTLDSSNPMTFPKYWKQNDVVYEFRDVVPGTYNITIVVTDEAGHATKHTVWIKNKVFDIQNTSGLVLELGGDYSQLTWTGFTTIPLIYEIVQGHMNISDVWNGGEISFDFSMFDPGNYSVDLLLRNGSEIVYTKTYNITIYPLSPPMISTGAQKVVYEWHKPVDIDLEFFDYNPFKIEIEIDGTLVDVLEWTMSNMTYRFDIPKLDEGDHRIDVRAYDQVNQVTKLKIDVTVLRPSVPIIVNFVQTLRLGWGELKRLSWEAHGVDSVEITLNGTTFKRIEVADTTFVFPLGWQKDKIGLGIYSFNLTLIGDETINKNLILNVVFDTGDIYADTVVQSDSEEVFDASAALNEPDTKSARITSGYSNGYLTLDMGERETIVNQEGDDLIVYATGGMYRVYGLLSVSGSAILLGTYNETSNIDLNTYGVGEIRYVRIENTFQGDIFVDAIEAIHLSTPDYENEIPSLHQIDNKVYWSNETEISLNVEAFSLTPWNYSIYVDNELYNHSYWLGGQLFVQYMWEDIGSYEIKIVVFNLFGNSNTSEFELEIISVLWAPENITRILVGAGIIGLLSITTFFLYRKYRK